MVGPMGPWLDVAVASTEAASNWGAIDSEVPLIPGFLVSVQPNHNHNKRLRSGYIIVYIMANLKYGFRHLGQDKQNYIRSSQVLQLCSMANIRLGILSLQTYCGLPAELLQNNCKITG
jgi:hypothetical protein